eukprot:7744142-Alexandrium_andersonii.AAC.1
MVVQGDATATREALLVGALASPLKCCVTALASGEGLPGSSGALQLALGQLRVGRHRKQDDLGSHVGTTTLSDLE